MKKYVRVYNYKYFLTTEVNKNTQKISAENMLVVS